MRKKRAEVELRTAVSPKDVHDDSEASNAVNGHILYVDGGILAYIGNQPE